MSSNNKNVSYIPFHWTHPLHMDLRPFELEYFELIPDYIDRLKVSAMQPHSTTALVNGRWHAAGDSINCGLALRRVGCSQPI